MPTLGEREARAQRIQQLLENSPEGLRLAILALPVRDRNPAKNDGPMPDLGEADTILRIWTVAQSIELARTSFFQLRISQLEKAAGIVIKDQAQAQALLRTPQSAPADDRILRRLQRPGYSVEWLERGFLAKKQSPVRVLAIRDSRRYPSYFTDLEPDIRIYDQGLEYLEKALGTQDLLDIRTHEQLEAEREPKEVVMFHSQRDELYREKLAAACAPFEAAKETLLELGDQEAFFHRVHILDPSGKIPNLFEAILHGRRHPELAECSNAFRLGFLAKIYSRQGTAELETLRQRVIWSSLVGAAQYVAAYEANTGAKNRASLDDVEFLCPGSLRLSIHKKPESAGQFLVLIGPSVHRTPWHGTAALHGSLNSKAVSLEIRMSIELKNENYVPVFVSPSSESHAVIEQMAHSKQPIAWISNHLLERLSKEGITDGDGILTRITQGDLRLFN